MPSNLPPGVSDSMLPGNRPEDEAWERVHNMIDADAITSGFTDIDVMVAWKLGLETVRVLRKMGTTFRHDPIPMPRPKP